MRRLSVEWFIDVPDDKKGVAENSIRSSTILLRQLKLLLDKLEDELGAHESKTSDYDIPSWAVKQAHRNGDRARIRKLRDLLSFQDEGK